MSAVRARLTLGVALLLALSACGTAPKKSAPPDAGRAESPIHRDGGADAGAAKHSPYAPAAEDPSKRGDYVAGGLYAPGVKDSIPDALPDVDAIPEPVVKDEPRSKLGNRDYAVLGKTYRVRDSASGYVEEGLASYYGKKFHGRLTSNQEVYDMYAFSAAHRTLPLPSFARVTNLANGKSVIVRVNDRGPFHSERIIDLSFAAATKLGFISQGTARVEVRALTPEEARDGDQPGARHGRRGARGKADDRTGGDRTGKGADTGDTAGNATSTSTTAAPVADPAMPADDFERWVRAQGIRVATGAPAPASSSSTPASAAVAAAEAPRPSASAPVGALPPTVAQAKMLVVQLASFGTRENAERARDRLRGGGIDDVRIDEASANGHPVWRIRVGPLPEDKVPELSARAADLGFRSPQIVRD